MAGAGKSEATTELVEGYGFERVYFGQVVLDEVLARSMPPGPESERAVREHLRTEEGMAVMAARSLPRIRSALSNGKRVCIDGLYSGAEWEVLSVETGVITLAVHASRWVRKARLKARSQRPLSGDELDERDLAEVRNVDKATPIALADAHIVNDGDVDALRREIASVMAHLGSVADARITHSRLAASEGKPT